MLYYYILMDILIYNKYILRIINNKAIKKIIIVI